MKSKKGTGKNQVGSNQKTTMPQKPASDEVPPSGLGTEFDKVASGGNTSPSAAPKVGLGGGSVVETKSESETRPSKLRPEFWISQLNQGAILVFGFSAAWFYTNRLMSDDLLALTTAMGAAFGVLAALSGILYAKASVCDIADRPWVLYCAEKFFHSSICVIQTIVLRFCEVSISKALVDVPYWEALATFAFPLFYYASNSMGIMFAFWGMHDLNAQLWGRLLLRIEKKKDRFI